MSHEPHDPSTARLHRADARLKGIKAADDVAAALRRLHEAVLNMDVRDQLALLESFPFPNVNCDVVMDIAAISYATSRWNASLRSPERFEKLGTRRWPESHRDGESYGEPKEG